MSFAAMFALSCMTPLVADDFNYSYSWSTGEKIVNLYDLKLSIHFHRKWLNGRYFSHLFAFFFLWKEKIWFNLANGAMASLLTFIISRYVGLRNGKTKYALLCLVIIFCFMPAWGQVFLWVDGACNYSWALVFTLAFLYPYCAAWLSKPVRLNFITGVLFIPFSFVAGAYLENGSLAVIGIALVLMAAMTAKKERFSFWLILAFLSASYGFYFMISAPSESFRGSFSISDAFGRLESIIPQLPAYYYIALTTAATIIITVMIILRKNRKAMFIFIGAGVSVTLAAGYILSAPEFAGLSVYSALCAAITSNAWSLLSVSTIYAMLLILSIYHRIDGRVLFISILLALAGIGSILVFLFAKYIPARAFMHYVAFLAIASAYMVSELSGSLPVKAKKHSAILLCSFFCVCLVLGFADISQIYRVSQSRQQTIDEAKENGIYEVAIPAFESKTKYSAPFQLDDVQEDWEQWPNPTMAEYYGLEKLLKE